MLWYDKMYLALLVLSLSPSRNQPFVQGNQGSSQSRAVLGTERGAPCIPVATWGVSPPSLFH